MFIGLPPLSIDGGPKGISIYQSVTKQSISSIKLFCCKGIVIFLKSYGLKHQKHQVENS